MSSPGAGFEFPSKEVSWLKRDVLLFAASIGCTVDELHFLYELHPNFCVFPTYSIILPFKGTTQEVIDFYASQRTTAIPGIPKLDPTRVVDGQRHIVFYKPLPVTSAGRKFEVRSKVLGVYDKGKPGTVVETETTIVDAGEKGKGGEVYTKIIGQGFYVGQGNWGGPKGPSATSLPPPKNQPPTLTHTFQLTPESAHLYRLNGDYNPLHATPEPGTKMGFGGAIMHGLSTWNFAAHAILKMLGNSDPANLREYQARFAAPVKPGDRLETRIWRTGNVDGDGFEDVRFVTSVGERVVLSNGRALVRVVDGGKKSSSSSSSSSSKL